MVNLKNINFMSKTQFDELSTLKDNELYAVNTPAVIDSYSDDSGNWYRVYSDGWVEQGGDCTLNQNNVNFHKPFANSNYNVQLTRTSNNYEFVPMVISKTTTYMTVVAHGVNNSTAVAQYTGNWRACGQGA